MNVAVTSFCSSAYWLNNNEKRSIFKSILNVLKFIPRFLSSIRFDTDTKRNRFAPDNINDEWVIYIYYMADHTGRIQVHALNQEPEKKNQNDSQSENITIDI